MTAPLLWTDAELADLQRDYDSDRGGHDDVVTLIRGVRAVLALHAPYDDDARYCTECGDERPVAYPCPTIARLNLEDTP
jgi:hypothetical protein